MIKVEKNSVINIDEERVCLTKVDLVYCNDNNITIATGHGNHTVKYTNNEEAREEFEILTQKLMQNPVMFKLDDNIVVNISNLCKVETNSIPTTDGKKEHVMVLRFKFDSRSIECGKREEMLDLAQKLNNELEKKNNAGV